MPVIPAQAGWHWNAEFDKVAITLRVMKAVRK